MMPLHRIHIAAALTLAATGCAIGSAQSTLSTNTHVVGHNYVHGRVTQTTTQLLYTTPPCRALARVSSLPLTL